MRGVTKDLDNQREPQLPIVFKWFGVLWFWLAGWRLVGKLPQDPKMVVISAPHTSNWDGWNLVMCGWACRVNLRWVVKEEFTRGLVGLFVRATGGLGIKRDKSYNLVEQVANKIRESDNLLLLVAPEGTRKRAEH